MKRVINFSAGPAVLPDPVLERIKADLPDFKNSGMSVMEIGHRTKLYDAVHQSAIQRLRQALDIPDDFEILLLQGGARLQFSMVAMNLAPNNQAVDLIHTGIWTKQAKGEIEKVTKLNVAYAGESNQFTKIPEINEVKLDPKAAYVHICANNTVYATQWAELPDTGNVPLICDMTSELLSRKLDFSKIGLIFASSQKNLGIAGVTTVIIRKDLLERTPETLPLTLQYKAQAKVNSLMNTPPTFAIYVLDLVLEWLQSNGGVAHYEALAHKRSQILYDLIDGTDFYTSKVDKKARSKMNVIFRLKDGDEELEKVFLEKAKEQGFEGLKGHRSVGGLRASIYNAQDIKNVEVLAQFMKDFEKTKS